jgi:hypothetical protein
LIFAGCKKRNESVLAAGITIDPNLLIGEWTFEATICNDRQDMPISDDHISRKFKFLDSEDFSLRVVALSGESEEATPTCYLTFAGSFSVTSGDYLSFKNTRVVEDSCNFKLVPDLFFKDLKIVKLSNSLMELSQGPLEKDQLYFVNTHCNSQFVKR